MISLAQNHVHTLTLPSFFKKEKRVEKSHQKSTQWTLTHPIQAEFLLETMRASVHRNGLADFAVALPLGGDQQDQGAISVFFSIAN